MTDLERQLQLESRIESPFDMDPQPAKVIERRGYCQHIRYRSKAVDQRSDTAIDDVEMKGLNGELKTQLTLAETKQEEILTNAR